VAANIAAESRTEWESTWFTDRAITRMSSLPARRPREGLKPNRPQQAAGMRIEPPPSLAWAIGTTPEAVAAAAPPDEPPVE
jgi:hypothetical protein